MSLKPLRVPRGLVWIGAVVIASAGTAQHTAYSQPASGGGSAPHGAMAMDRQAATLNTWVGERPKVERPAWAGTPFWASLIPKDNPGSAEQVALGKKLFFDMRLSRDGTVACATCHDASRGLSDRRSLFEGVGGSIGKRNSPTVMNALFYASQFWDGRAATLEDQARLPIVNPIEMGQPNERAAVAAIAGDAAYQDAFRKAYGKDVNFDDLVRAIGAFERTLIFMNSPFDRFVRGDANAISADARAGWALFNGKGRCTACHQMSGDRPIGTDNRFHNVGVSARHQDFEGLAKKALAVLQKDSSKEAIDQLALQTDLSELGRFVVTRNRADIGGFRTPQVRNVGVTGPYMHDGSLTTLWDVMDHYNKGGEPNAFLDGGMEPLDLTEREIDQMVAFMFALTDERLAEQNRTEMQRQRTIATKRRPFRDEALEHRKTLLFEQRLKRRK